MESAPRLVGRRARVRTPSASGPTTDPESLALLRSRVAGFGLAVAAIGAAGLTMRTAITFVFQANQSILEDPTFGWHLAATLAFGAVGPAVWLGPKRTRWVIFVEGAGLVLGSLCYVAMGAYIPIEGAPVETVALILTFGAVARAIYVPSTPKRTLLLHLHIGLPFAALMYVVASRNAARTDLLARLRDMPFGFQLHEPWELGFFAAFGVLFWFGLSTAVCVAASHVIFGLRRQVADGRHLGQYTLEAKLGEGGMGVVYRASHALLRRPTAIKILHAAGETTPGETRRRLARFEREVQLTAGLTHPNTITVFDYGHTPEGLFYYAMELLDGATLEEVVAVGGPLPGPRVVHVLRQVAAAMIEAHGVGLIHRDLKPANIMLAHLGGEADVAKVLDFGLVKEQDEGSPALSRADQLTGTPDYLAPEAISAPESVDARTDLYALGAVAYYLLTGRRVFEGRTLVEVCSQHLHQAPEPPSARLGAEVHAGLEALVMRCLEKTPARRHGSARSLLLALRQLDVPAWSAAEAEAWWATYSAALRSRRSVSGTPDSPTLAIALMDRA